MGSKTCILHSNIFLSTASPLARCLLYRLAKCGIRKEFCERQVLLWCLIICSNPALGFQWQRASSPHRVSDLLALPPYTQLQITKHAAGPHGQDNSPTFNACGQYLTKWPHKEAGFKHCSSRQHYNLVENLHDSAGGFFFVKVEGGLGCKERRNWERVVVCRGGGNPQRRLAPLV